MEPETDPNTKARQLLEDLAAKQPKGVPPSDHLRPLLVALGCSLLGVLPLIFGYDDSVLWLAWIAILALPVGIFTRAQGLQAWPFGLVAPGIWMMVLAYLEMGSITGLPDPALAAVTWVGLVLVGTSVGAYASGRAYRTAGLAFCLMTFLAWLPISGGSNANLFGKHTVGQESPDLASRLFDTSPMTLLVESAGVDWMRHPSVYTEAGTEWFSDRRRPFDGMLIGPTILLIGCLGIFLSRVRASSR